MFVLVLDNVNSKACEILEKEGFEFKVINKSEILENIENAIAIICRFGTEINKEIIDKAENLKVIARSSVGADDIDIDYAKSMGIKVVNAPMDNIVSTAEYTFGMMLAIARNIPRADRDVKDGNVDRADLAGMELRGKTLGVIGLGHIGKEVAKRALAFEMEVIVFDPFVDEFKDVEIVDELDELLKRSDIITIHVPLIEQTRGMINKEAIKKMKKGVILINCARGGIVVEEDMLEALDDSHIDRVAVDVFEDEHTYGTKLQNHAKVIATPHLGGSTAEALLGTAVTAANQVVEILKGGAGKYEL